MFWQGFKYEAIQRPSVVFTPVTPLQRKIIPRGQLPIQALARLSFGEHLLSVLGLADTVKLEAAKNLPPSVQGGETNANAFRNSYLWKASTGVLNVHGTSLHLELAAVGSQPLPA